MLLNVRSLSCNYYVLLQHVLCLIKKSIDLLANLIVIDDIFLIYDDLIDCFNKVMFVTKFDGFN